MQSKRLLNSLVLPIMLTFCSTLSSYGSVTNADNWRSFGNQTLYFLASGQCPIPAWLQRQQPLYFLASGQCPIPVWLQRVTGAFAEPDLRASVIAVESFSEQAMEDYETDNFTWQGRIPLDINPRCILGLYLTDKFPGTKLADTGKRLFGQSIEGSCLVAFGAEAPWQKLLEAELTKTDRGPLEGFKPEFFDKAETPFLLIYLIENGSSQAVQQQARKQLAHCLEKQYGLEPALRRYRILLEKAYTAVDESTKLKVAGWLEQTGATCDGEQLYEKILQATDLPEVAAAAAENLARVRLAKSRQIDAWQALDVLHKRFPDIELTSEDLKSFFLNFQTDREKRLEQLIGELSAAQEEEKVLELCRLCCSLWTEHEALDQWQDIIDNVKPESLASRFARLYLARSLVDTGKVNEAKDILTDLSSSTYPAIRSGALLISADMALALNRTTEAVTLYQQAAQIERPTVLPQWFKAFQIKQVDVEKLTAEELSFLAWFLRGYNELIDGNFEIAAANLLKAREVTGRLLRKSLPGEAKKAIPGMLMLAYAKMGDYAKAEQYGLEAIRNLQEDGQGSSPASTSSTQIERVSDSLFVLSGALRTLQEPGPKSQLEHYARKVYYTAVTTQSSLSTDFGPAKSGLVQLFSQIKRQRVVRLLSAEYDWAKSRLTKPGSLAQFLGLEPVIFTAQLLDKDSFEQIRTALAAATGQEYAEGQMYRFARFAQRVVRPYVARMALNVAAQQIDTVRGNVKLLENIADMYLAGNSHQKAIEIYQRIVEQVSDANEAQKAQLRIIKVYAEQLKLYDRAIGECQKFLKKFAGSGQISQVEFLMGKLAYLFKDYASAVGQLDSFQRKYPEDPQIGDAMMLAALSRMSEGNTQDAIDRFTEIIQKYPEDDLAARSKFLVGYAQVSAQKYSQALETFKQLIEQFPRSKYTKQAQSFIDRLSKVSQ